MVGGECRRLPLSFSLTNSCCLSHSLLLVDMDDNVVDVELVVRWISASLKKSSQLRNSIPSAEGTLIYQNKLKISRMIKNQNCRFPVPVLGRIKQGRIHGYPSRLRVGRGSNEIDQLGSWAGAVTPKPPVDAEKAKCYRRTDGRTDRVGCTVACTRLKTFHIDQR